MEYNETLKKCSCPAGTALGASGACTECASGFASASGVCLSGCYELGAQFYYESDNDNTDSDSASAFAGKVCLECAGVVQTDESGFRTCVSVLGCPTTPVEVNGVMACLEALPALTTHMEYDSGTGALVEVLASVSDKTVAAQAKDASGNVLMLFSDKTQRLILANTGDKKNFTEEAINVFVTPGGFGRVLASSRQLQMLDLSKSGLTFETQTFGGSDGKAVAVQGSQKGVAAVVQSNLGTYLYFYG